MSPGPVDDAGSGSCERLAVGDSADDVGNCSTFARSVGKDDDTDSTSGGVRHNVQGHAALKDGHETPDDPGGALLGK